MNQTRRKQLQEALTLIEQADALLSEAQSIVSDVRDEEQEAFDNIPESLQQAERGERMQEAISALESVELEDALSEHREYIQQAIDA